MICESFILLLLFFFTLKWFFGFDFRMSRVLHDQPAIEEEEERAVIWQKFTYNENTTHELLSKAKLNFNSVLIILYLIDF